MSTQQAIKASESANQVPNHATSFRQLRNYLSVPRIRRNRHETLSLRDLLLKLQENLMVFGINYIGVTLTPFKQKYFRHNSFLPHVFESCYNHAAGMSATCLVRNKQCPDVGQFRKLYAESRTVDLESTRYQMKDFDTSIQVARIRAMVAPALLTSITVLIDKTLS